MTVSSRETAITIANTMIGSSIIVLPILFLQSGLLVAIAILILLCLIQFQTCNLIIQNLPERDNDIS